MELFITYHGQTMSIIHNATLAPRKGDTILATTGISFNVKEVVWHIDNRTWVEIQVG